MPRSFTLAEANRVLRSVAPLLDEVRAVMERIRHARDQLADLRIIWGDQVERESCPDHLEYDSFRRQFQSEELRLRELVAEVSEQGCEIKDPDAGLVDFYAERGGQGVYLCWKRGEPDIRFWHTLTDGFAGRKPIKSF